jgi:hypothetical protein
MGTGLADGHEYEVALQQVADENDEKTSHEYSKRLFK